MHIDLINLTKKNIKILFISTFVFGVLSIFYAKSIDNIYESKSIIFATDSSSSVPTNSFFSNFIEVGDSAPNTRFASKILFSRDFFEILYRDDSFASQLMAYDKFYPNTNTEDYDLDMFDINSNKWRNGKPPLELAHKKFLANHFTFLESSENGFFNVNIRHQSPYIAKKWNDFIFSEINKYVGEYKRLLAEDALDYLIPLLAEEKNASIKINLSNIISSKYNEIALTQNSNYVFSIVSKPFIPLKKSSPNRALICFAITIMGFIFTFFVILAQEILYISKNTKI